MKNPLLIILTLLLSIKSVQSQTYIPENKDYLLKVLDDKYDNQLSLIKGNEYRSKIKKEYKKRRKVLKETLTDSLYVFNNKYSEFLKTVVEKVKKNNPLLKTEDDLFFINRSPIPNAACFGNGVYMFNLGLFYSLDSEDEFAFILCHELAHQKLNHVNNSIRSLTEKVNSKKYKRKIRDARLTIYGRTNAGLNLLKELTYGVLKKSVKSEFEADSLGLVFFNKTSYNIKSSSKSLSKFKDFNDNGIFSTKIVLHSLLNFPNYPFKQYWLDSEETMFDIKEKIDDYKWSKDSLKTHPDIEERIKKIESFNSFKKSKATTTFKEIKAFAEEELIKSLIDFNQIDIAMYFLLKKTQEKKASSFVITQTARCFKKIYELKKNHEFGKKVPQVSPFSKEKNINMLRGFLHNLEIKHVRKLGYNYCGFYGNQLKINTEEFNNIKDFFTNLNN